jgi:predicted DNA-binding antitoxin AbrB/MazE fold protein
MTTSVRATYEKGVFKPSSPVPLADGTEVQLTITDGTPANDPAGVVAELQRIAALPTEGPDDGFSGADHDSVLYRGEKR